MFVESCTPRCECPGVIHDYDTILVIQLTELKVSAALQLADL